MTIFWLPGFLSMPDDPVPIEGECLALPTLLPRDVPAAIDALGKRLRPSDVVIGYSMGGRLLLQTLASGVRVRAAVFLSTSPGLEDPHERARRYELDASRAAWLSRDPAGFVEAWGQEPVFLPSRENLAWRAQQERRKRLSSEDARAWAHVLVAMSPGALRPCWDDLAHLSCPSLWLAGARDVAYAQMVEKVARVSDRAAVDILPGVGHALPLEAPADVRKLVRRFFERERISP